MVTIATYNSSYMNNKICVCSKQISLLTDLPIFNAIELLKKLPSPGADLGFVKRRLFSSYNYLWKMLAMLYFL